MGCPVISLQLLDDVPCGTGHLVGLGGFWIHWHSLFPLLCCKPNGGCSLFQVYQSCKGCRRDGKGRTVLLWLTRCQHNGSMAQHPDSLKSIVPPACLPACSNILHFCCMLPEMESLVNWKMFCCCLFLPLFSPNVQHTMEAQCARRGQASERDVLRWVLLYLLATYTCLFPYGLQCRHMQLKIARPLGIKALAGGFLKICFP